MGIPEHEITSGILYKDDSHGREPVDYETINKNKPASLGRGDRREIIKTEFVYDVFS